MSQEFDQFEKELKTLINKHSIDNELNIPDYVLAGSLVSQLIVFRGLVDGQNRFFNFRPFDELKQELKL